MTILAEETVAELDGAIEEVTVQTPCSPFAGEVVDVDKICAVSIVRAGDRCVYVSDLVYTYTHTHMHMGVSPLTRFQIT